MHAPLASQRWALELADRLDGKAAQDSNVTIQNRRAEEMTIDELATCHQRTAAGSRHDRLTNAGRAATTAAPLTLEIGELKALPSLLRRILRSPPSDCLAYCRFGSRN